MNSESAYPEDTSSDSDSMIDASVLQGKLLQGRFLVGEKIGNGSFGEIRLGKDTDKVVDVAIKLERSGSSEQLPAEAAIYMILQGASNGYEGIPKYYGQGCQEGFNYLIIELLGPCIEDCLEKCDNKLEFKDVLQIGYQALARIEFLHHNGYIFRDVKPENFLIGKIGTISQNIIRICDFGLTKRYIEKGVHIPNKKKKGVTGTARYVSIATHENAEQSRRDDIESLGYLIIYLTLDGHLPWQGLVIKTEPGLTKRQLTDRRYAEIAKVKKRLPLETLCEKFPEMAEWIQYGRDMKFDETPDYKRLRKILKDVMIRVGVSTDCNDFSWTSKFSENDNSKLRDLPKTASALKVHSFTHISPIDRDEEKMKIKDDTTSTSDK